MSITLSHSSQKIKGAIHLTSSKSESNRALIIQAICKEKIDFNDHPVKAFLQKTEGSPIRRIGYDAWLRNIAVALGNAEGGLEVVQALQAKKAITSNEMVLEHIDWALMQHELRASSS